MDTIIIDLLTEYDFDSSTDRTIISALLIKITDKNLKTVLFSLFHYKDSKIWYERLIELQLDNIQNCDHRGC